MTSKVLVILQAAFLAALAIEYPPNAQVSDGDSFDFVIVGGGTAGCVLATRLSEVKNVKVLVVEAGGDPPQTAELPGAFSTLPDSPNDWNYTSVPDGVTAQNLKNNVHHLTAGKMLGGSGNLHHMMYLRGFSEDYNNMVKAANDDSWSYDAFLPYFKKSEVLRDAEILASPTAKYHGTNGNIAVSRQPDEANEKYLESFKELGNKIVQDFTEKDTLAYSQPLLTIFNGTRQSTANTYLSPVGNRSNLFVLKDCLVTKIIFDSKTAVGVIIRTKENKDLRINVSKEVISSAGAFRSPQLLLLSGIGPKSQLSKFGIENIADLPVGVNYQDRPAIMVLHMMDPSNATVAAPDPSMFPAPTTVGLVGVDDPQGRVNYISINLLLPHDTEIFLAVCGSVFGYKDEICQTFYKAAQGRNTVATCFIYTNPISRGKLELQSSNPEDAPLIETGLYSNPSDVSGMAKALAHFSEIVNTTYFKSVGASLVDPELEKCKSYAKGSEDYWKCYALNLSFASWQYASGNSLGSVVDNKLRVKSVKNLRVVDASVIPQTMNGEYFTPVIAIAEKASDIIKSDWNLQ